MLAKKIGKLRIPKTAVLFLPFISTALISFFSGAQTVSATACDTNSWKYCNPLEGTVGTLVEAGTKTVQTLLGLIGTIALLLLVIAGLTYMTAAGDEEKIKKAKSIVTGTIIGLGIALIAFSLLQTLEEILGVN
ncbi:MAG: hypothetical protein PHX30_04785 [Candidatus Pacebacteria bacterium]|nr:hypothetical protein [Candidatus Paceibacterota bacterium]